MPYRDDRTRDIFRYLCRYETQYGFSPTMGEIARELGFRSNSGIIRHLDKLERWGWIERHHGQARSIRLIHKCEVLDALN